MAQETQKRPKRRGPAKKIEDLVAGRAAKNVKGGNVKLMQSCATGRHVSS